MSKKKQMKKKRSRNEERKQLRKQGQTPKKPKRQKPNRVKPKAVTDFTHALSHVTVNEETNQRLLYTKCEFPIVHSKITETIDTNMLKVRKEPLIIKRNNKVTCPNCKKKLDNFLVAFRKRRMRRIRNFFYRLSLVRLPKLKIGEKRREKKRLRLMADIEDQAIDMFIDKMVSGVKDWRKFVEKHHKDRYEEYLELINMNNEDDEDNEIFLEEEELVFDEEEVDNVSTNTVTTDVDETETETEIESLDEEQEEENETGEVQDSEEEQEDFSEEAEDPDQEGEEVEEQEE